MKLEPIRLRLVPRKQVSNESNPRDEFWRSIRRNVDQDSEISESEGKLCREFGPALKALLVQELAEPLRQIENTLYRGEFRDIEHFLFRFFDGPRSDKSWDQAQVLDSFTKLLEQRQQIYRDSPALQRAQERIVAASTVTYSVRIAGYSSLNLDLSIGSIGNLAQAFENDFESFRVFLEAFVPQAFGRVFWEENANKLDFSVQIPAAYEQAFHVPDTPAATPAAEVPSVASNLSSVSARDRAEWLWRLANGSLLVPLLLALAVMYFGMGMLRDISGSQNEALKPILEHQLKLLEEDRHRLYKENPSSVVTPPAGNGK